MPVDLEKKQVKVLDERFVVRFRDGAGIDGLLAAAGAVDLGRRFPPG